MAGRTRAASGRYFERPDRSLSLGIGLLVLFELLALLVPTDPLAVEARCADWLRDAKAPALEKVALVFNDLGRGVGQILSIAAIALALALARRWAGLLAFALTEGITALASSLTKALTGRPRPPDSLVHPAGSSFPSGHTTYAAATCVALVLLYTSVGPRRRWWWTIAALVTAAMGWSRMYLQVHWLLDVIGGAALGAGIALFVFAVVQLQTSGTRLNALPPRPIL